MPRKRKERTIFVEPQDPDSNHTIAEMIPCDKYCHEGKSCAEGEPRSVWEFPPHLKDRLARLLYLENVHIALFIEDRDGKLVPFARPEAEALV